MWQFSYCSQSKSDCAHLVFVNTERKSALHGRSNGGMVSVMTKFGKEEVREDRRAHNKK